jgi:urea transport system substrate-binding protein
MRGLLGIPFLLLLLAWGAPVHSEEPIRIGALYSLTGTMAISESGLRDALLMQVEQQNLEGGLLGQPLEVVEQDPASNWSMYGEKARQLIERENVAAIFGCWTSASRKEVKSVVEELDGLLFYPVQYEGHEQSPNIFYLGATPNQQALPAVDYLIEQHGIQRWVLAGTDYIYPRTTNELLAAYLERKGFAADNIMLSYTPFGHTDWKRIVQDIQQFGSQGRKTAVVSTVNGDANVALYRELAAQGITASTLPVMAFSVGEAELQAMDVGPMVGHLAAWNYFMSLDNPGNHQFIADLQSFTGDSSAVVNDPIEAQAVGFRLWVKAVQQAGTTDPEAVRKTMIGMEVANLSGGSATLQPNHHLSKPVYIGEIRPDGQYNVIWHSTANVDGMPWFDPASTDEAH